MHMRGNGDSTVNNIQIALASNLSKDVCDTEHNVAFWKKKIQYNSQEIVQYLFYGKRDTCLASACMAIWCWPNQPHNVLCAFHICEFWLFWATMPKQQRQQQQ